jgi:NAD(P)-dependent dehydrogenase (short-subunit alcohol dehydrogenase family)
MMKVSRGRVLVTGASRGIGRAVVEALVTRGAHVAALGRDTDALMDVARIAPDKITAVVGDLSDADTRRELVPRAVEALGGLDGLVCAAGMIRRESVDHITPEAIDAQLVLNFRAPLELSLAFAQHVKSRVGSGAIVHLSSTLASRPSHGTLVYAATKAAVEAMTRGLALELAPNGIRVNAIAPGIVDTDMVRGARGEESTAEVEQRMSGLRALHPLGRLGRPDDIAHAAVHLLDAEWTTGTVLHVDGGLSVG